MTNPERIAFSDLGDENLTAEIKRLSDFAVRCEQAGEHEAAQGAREEAHRMSNEISGRRERLTAWSSSEK